MSSGTLKRLTWAEYLALERNAETKSEFYDGKIFAMAGATRRHDLAAGNVFARLHEQLRSGECEVFQNDMRVRCPNGLGTYPDVVVACDPLFEDDSEETLLNPVVIVEVLSASTEAWDRGDKFKGYCRLNSLREYVLVSQKEPLVEHYVRQSQFDSWLLTSYSNKSDRVTLPSLDVSLSVSDVYARIDFSQPDADL